MVTWGSGGLGSAGELSDFGGSQPGGSCGKEEGRGEESAGGAEPSLPSFSGPFGFCSWLQLHSRLQWPWKELLAGILAVGSGTRPCAIANCNISLFHVQETGFSWESAWTVLILPSCSPVGCWRALRALAQDLGLEPLGISVLPGGEIRKGDYFYFQAGMQLEARLGRQ